MGNETIISTNSHDCIIITGTCGSGKTTLAAKLVAKTGAYLYTEDEVFMRAIEAGRMPLAAQQDLSAIQALRLETLKPAFKNHAAIVCDIHLHTMMEVKWFLDVIENALGEGRISRILIVKMFPPRETSEKFLRIRAEKRARGKSLAEAAFARFIEVQNLNNLDSQRTAFQEVLKTSFEGWASQKFSISEVTVTDPTKVSIL